MQSRDEEGAGHGSRVAHRHPADPGEGCATLDGMAVPCSLPLLTSRLHVDLQRTSSAVCSRG
jgi:hypothetical protein